MVQFLIYSKLYQYKWQCIISLICCYISIYFSNISPFTEVNRYFGEFICQYKLFKNTYYLSFNIAGYFQSIFSVEISIYLFRILSSQPHQRPSHCINISNLKYIIILYYFISIIKLFYIISMQLGDTLFNRYCNQRERVNNIRLHGERTSSTSGDRFLWIIGLLTSQELQQGIMYK